MRFRHAIPIDLPHGADRVFDLITNLTRLAEWHPEMPTPTVLTDCHGDVGHAVHISDGAQVMTVTLSALNRDARTASTTYSLGFTLDWTVLDHGASGCLLRVDADIARFTPGQEAEDFRGALLRDLGLLKAALESH